MTTFYRSTYHHGDARGALIRAALHLARRGGPRMVTLRAAAREVGITATAVYRHFATADELLDAVKGRALRLLADRVEAAESLVPAAGAARLHAAAGGYLAFAREHPGLFAMACHGGADAVRDLISHRLTDLPAPSPRPGAGLAVWSAVHGVTLLATDGSLRDLPETTQHAHLTQVLDIILTGLTHPAPPERQESVPPVPAAVTVPPVPTVPAGPGAGAPLTDSAASG